MKYYHATLTKLSAGQTITSNGTLSTFYANSTTELDKLRPENAPTRSTALYTTDSLDLAYYYKLKQNEYEKKEGAEIYLYEVEVSAPWKAVFCITSAVDKKLQNKEAASALTKEYWNPTKKWYFYEYLSESFTVIKEEEKPNINETLMFNSYLQDGDLIKSLS